MAGGDQQLELRQALQQGFGERRALAHDADDLEVPQPLDQGIGIGDGVAEHRDLGL